MDDAEREIVHEDEDEELEQEGRKFEYQRVLKAQEPLSSNQLDGIQLTPFNLTEELEDGQFDQSGNFLFNRKKKTESDDEGGQDAWAESIDWQEMSRRERERERNAMDVDQDQLSALEPRQQESSKDKVTCYKEMLRIMKHDETVQKAIRRLGNSIPKRRFTKSRHPKQNTQPDDGCSEADIAEAKRKLETLTELAQMVLQNGDDDIYQKSFDDLEDAIN